MLFSFFLSKEYKYFMQFQLHHLNLSLEQLVLNSHPISFVKAELYFEQTCLQSYESLKEQSSHHVYVKWKK